jgi:UDP-N-acetylmuramoyl-L-alanyl-D-glutamate--2,6-diaminopimelate ligase
MDNLIKQLKTILWRVKSLCAIFYYGNPAKKLKIVGVTGTNGKTTTATLLYKIALELGYKAGLIGTVEILANDEKLDIEHKIPTTPDSVTLTKIFKIMVDKKCEYVFMEVSSHAMDQNRVWGVHFIGGVFTNLTQDHLDYHENMEEYFLAKKKFFKMLPSKSFALANADDEYGKKMLEDIKAQQFLYGFGDSPDFKGEIHKLDFLGLELKFMKKNLPTVRHVKSKLLGKFNAYNLLAVWSACSLLHFDMIEVDKILENIKPPRGRFEHFTSYNGVLVIVDYAHTPDALENVLQAIHSSFVDKKVISVFGCGGDRDATKRPIMGKIGATNSDIAIFTSDNPRSEDPETIIAQMKTSLSSKDLEKVKTISNRHEAILEAVKLAKSGDVVLCAGKGHEDYQIIKGVKSHFDDMEEFKKAYAQK